MGKRGLRIDLASVSCTSPHALVVIVKLQIHVINSQRAQVKNLSYNIVII